MITRQLLIGLGIFFSGTVLAQSPLENCAEQFIDGDAANAPTLFDTPANTPFGNNEHLCYRDDGVSFFATEYWPDNFAPRWAAYKIDPSKFGTNGCSIFSRKKHNCYAKRASFADFQACTSNPGDPFHEDHVAIGEKLVPDVFGLSGHDNGHIAPRQAFSWHVCGNYQTFSMANMSPQRGFLNQRIWRRLEEQVLTWGFDEGPIFVTTGTVFTDFPHDKFEVFEDDGLVSDQVYEAGTTLEGAVTQNAINFADTSADDILRPMRTVNLADMENDAKQMLVPTGYFKVIFRPATASDPAHAIAFMLPHSFENLNMAADFFSNLTRSKAFWLFVSRIDLIEETSGITFPGIPEDLKSDWGSDFFFDRDSSRNISSGCSDNDDSDGFPQGILTNSTKAERVAACTDLL